MAKPIRSTPVVRGVHAVRFVKAMVRESKHPSKTRVQTIHKALEEFKYFRQYLESKHPSTLE